MGDERVPDCSGADSNAQRCISPVEACAVSCWAPLLPEQHSGAVKKKRMHISKSTVLSRAHLGRRSGGRPHPLRPSPDPLLPPLLAGPQRRHSPPSAVPKTAAVWAAAAVLTGAWTALPPPPPPPQRWDPRHCCRLQERRQPLMQRRWQAIQSRRRLPSLLQNPRRLQEAPAPSHRPAASSAPPGRLSLLRPLSRPCLPTPAAAPPRSASQGFAAGLNAAASFHQSPVSSLGCDNLLHTSSRRTKEKREHQKGNLEGKWKICKTGKNKLLHSPGAPPCRVPRHLRSRRLWAPHGLHLCLLMWRAPASHFGFPWPFVVFVLGQTWPCDPVRVSAQRQALPHHSSHSRQTRSAAMRNLEPWNCQSGLCVKEERKNTATGQGCLTMPVSRLRRTPL